LSDEIDGPRMARFVTGQCPPAEAAEIRRWLAEDPAREALVHELGRIWELARLTTSDWDVDRAWHDLRAAREAAPPVARPARPAWHWRAAAAMVLAGAGTLAWHFTHRTNQSSAAALTEIATRRGQRATLRLTDGTRVDLGVASTIRYAPNYGAEKRDLHLEGEAYFEVAHDPARPFVVHTATAVARDLGTRFGVRAYPSSGEVEVVVVEGAVDLRAATPHGASDRVLLARADLGRVDRSGRFSVAHGADTVARLAWRQGRLVFRNTPLREALPQLSRWYDADFQLADPALGAHPLTASLRGEPLPQVLELLAAALAVRVERQGTAVVFYRKLRPR
jgi:transmembrane sensor